MRQMLVSILVLSALAACGGSAAEGADPDEVTVSSEEAELRTNREPGRVVVYSNNIENMIFDWKDLVHVMAEDELRPESLGTCFYIYIRRPANVRTAVARLT